MTTKLRSAIAQAALLTLLVAALVLVAAVALGATNIDSTFKYAWSENTGWLNGQPSGAAGPGIEVTGTDLKGYIWGENIGWVNLSCLTNALCVPPAGTWGVKNDGVGNLKGYAWSENAGWVNFSCQTNASCGGPGGAWGVTINASGDFTGRAWAENIGWISFNCNNNAPTCPVTASYHMHTTWQPAAGTTFVVNTNDDVDKGVCSVLHCSLREAINASNAAPGAQTIAFNIPGAGVHTITPTAALPTITDSVTVDATTQPGWVAGAPRIELVGTSAGSFVSGLRVLAGPSNVKGLIIHGFDEYGIFVNGPGVVISGNFIGTDSSGTTAPGSPGCTACLGVGIALAGGANAVVGGTTVADRNVLSGNSTGVEIEAGAGVNNLIEGNYIGLNASGVGALANGSGIVALAPGSNTVIIGAVGAPNYISGSAGYGVRIDSIQSIVRANVIGLNVLGAAIPNGLGGVFLTGTLGGPSHNNLIEQNVISGNTGNGVTIQDGGSNVIRANRIGADAAGTVARPNGGAGISISGSPSNTVGGTTAADRNIISGNTGAGLTITGAAATANVVKGNYIGTDLAGNAALANGDRGIVIDANGQTIGDTSGGANTISGNTADGLLIYSNGNTIAGNFIGVNAAGAAALANGFSGVDFRGAASNNTVTANVIGSNAQSGIDVIGTTSNANSIDGNWIGTNASAAVLGNVLSGIAIANGSSGTRIGAVAPNTIVNNGGSGVRIIGATSIGNQITRNAIHDNTGLGIDLGGDGVTPNTPGGPHVGPNDLQNFPVVTGATLASGNVTVTGTLNTTPSTALTIEFFVSGACDPSGNGEGQTYLGAATVTTDGSGNASFAPVIPAATVTAGQKITATATRNSVPLDTSEFSACAAVSGAAVGFVNPGIGLPCWQDHLHDLNNDGYSDSDAATPPGPPTCTGAYPLGGGLGLDPGAPCTGRNLSGTAAQIRAAVMAASDVNLDGKVNILDLSAAAGYYNQGGFMADPTDKRNEFDVNHDDKVNILDLSRMAGFYNMLVPPC